MTPVRFLHTFDVHLDTSFSGASFPSRVGDRKRAEMRATFRRMLDEARGAVDVVLIAGVFRICEIMASDPVDPALKRAHERLPGQRVSFTAAVENSVKVHAI